MNLNEFTEEEIIERKEKFLKRLDKLMSNISDYLKNHNSELGYRIIEEYKSIKEEIREEAKFLNCRKNDISGISQTHANYSGGIQEASAWGFAVKSNGKIDQKMLSAVEEAKYKLNKYF